MLFSLLSSNKMIGGGRGGGGGGGIIGDQLVWEVGAVVVTWFPKKGKQLPVYNDVILSGLVEYFINCFSQKILTHCKLMKVANDRN